jgi:hypothetical protein
MHEILAPRTAVEGSAEALLAVDRWANEALRLARLARSQRRSAAVFYAWTRARRLALDHGLNIDEAVTLAKRLVAYFITSEGWAETPAGRLQLTLVAVHTTHSI